MTKNTKINRKCVVCGNLIGHWERSDKRFCHENCRMKYVNERRKVERKRDKALKAIAELKATIGSGYLEDIEIIDMLLEIRTATLLGGTADNWKCGECGQISYLTPEHGQACPYCDTVGQWLPVQPAKPSLEKK